VLRQARKQGSYPGQLAPRQVWERVTSAQCHPNKQRGNNIAVGGQGLSLSKLEGGRPTWRSWFMLFYVGNSVIAVKFCRTP